MLDDPVYASIVDRDLPDAQHRDGLWDGTRGTRSYFTTAYLHPPDEIAEEMSEAGLRHAATLAIEGPAWLLQDLDEQWHDTHRQSAILVVVST